MGIKENTEASKEAKEWIAEFGDKPQRFWEQLIESAIEKLPPKRQINYSNPKEIKPMNDILAMSFEREKIPYGQHKGAYVGQVKLDYLIFLAEENDFTRDVKRYVASAHFKKRMKGEN